MVLRGPSHYFLCFRNLSLNPFLCDCNLAWLPRWLDRKKVKIVRPLDTKCAQPPEVASLPLFNVSFTDTTCGKRKQSGSGRQHLKCNRILLSRSQWIMVLMCMASHFHTFTLSQLFTFKGSKCFLPYISEYIFASFMPIMLSDVMSVILIS